VGEASYALQQPTATTVKTPHSTSIVLATCALYYVCMAGGQLVMRYVGGARYATGAMLPWIFPIQLLMVLLLTYVTKRYLGFEQVGLTKVQTKERRADLTLTILPIVLAALLLVYWLVRLPPQGRALLNLDIVTLGVAGIALVRVSEEWMFRGIARMQPTRSLLAPVCSA
jgi:hypothetical protein